jgi:hypothetical protein
VHHDGRYHGVLHIDPIMNGPPASAYAVHRVTITPFAQEMRRDTSLWGRLFDFRAITGPVSSNGISFTTRKRAESLSAGLSSPTKNGGIFMTVTSPLTSFASPPSSGNGIFYPQSRAFEEKRTCPRRFNPLRTKSKIKHQSPSTMVVKVTKDFGFLTMTLRNCRLCRCTAKERRICQQMELRWWRLDTHWALISMRKPKTPSYLQTFNSSFSWVARSRSIE